MRLFGRNFLIAVLVATQMGVASPAFATPPPNILPTAQDGLVDFLLKVAQNPFSPAVALAFATITWGYTVKNAIASTLNSPAAYYARKEKLREAFRFAKEYEIQEHIVKELPAEAEKLRAEQKDLRRQILEISRESPLDGRLVGLRQSLRNNQAKLEGIVRSVPFLEVRDKLERLGELHEQIDAHIRRLGHLVSQVQVPRTAAARREMVRRGRQAAKNGAAAVVLSDAHALANGLNNGPHDPKVQHWVERLSKETAPSRDAVRDFLDSKQGEDFTSTLPGDNWLRQYKDMRGQARAYVEDVPRIVNKVAEEHNRQVEVSKQRALLRPIRDEHGDLEDTQWWKENKNSPEKGHPISADAVVRRTEMLCLKNLGLLAKRRDSATHQASYRVAFHDQFKKVGIAVATTAAGYGGLRLFRNQTGKELPQVREELRQQAEVEKQKMLDEARTREIHDALVPLQAISADVLVAARDGIEKRVYEVIPWDEKKEKSDLLDERRFEAINHPEAEKERIAAALEASLMDYYRGTGSAASLKERLKIVREEADPNLAHDMIVVYRNALQRLYPGIMDNDVLNRLEPKELLEASKSAVSRLIEQNKTQVIATEKDKGIDAAGQAPKANGSTATSQTPAETKTPVPSNAVAAAQLLLVTPVPAK